MKIEKNRKGRLIVIDGVDGSGKATQTELLFNYLQSQGRKVQKIDFPRYSKNTMGKFLRECLDGKHGDFIGLDPKQASLGYALDRYESSREIWGWLEEGTIVIADRYVSANQIHQGGKIADDAARAEFLTWLEKLEFGILNLPRPDIIVYLHVPLEISLELVKTRAKEKGENLDLAESNHTHLYHSQQAALGIISENNGWVKIDCANTSGGIRTREDIHAEVLKKLQEVLSVSS
jgi:dTMP kinase